MSDSVRRLIERRNADLCIWYASGEVDAVVEVFCDDCWQMPPNTEPLVGRTALRDFWMQAVQWGKWQFNLETQDVVVSGLMAIERGTYTLGFQAGPMAPPGMESSVDRGNYVVTWRKEQDGCWRILWDAPVSTLPLESE